MFSLLSRKKSHQNWLTRKEVLYLNFIFWMQKSLCCPFQSQSCMFCTLSSVCILLFWKWTHMNDSYTVLPSYFGWRCWLLCCIGPNCQITSSVWLWICCHVYYSLTSEIHFQVKCFSSYRVIVVSQFNQNVMLTFIWNTLNFLWLLEVLLTLIPIKILKLPVYQNCMLINLMKLPAN